jgi:hypothetical protein
MVDVGIILLGLGTTVAVGGLVFLAGFVIQSLDYRNEKRKRVARVPTTTYYVASEPAVSEPYEPAPPTPPLECPSQYWHPMIPTVIPCAERIRRESAFK